VHISRYIHLNPDDWRAYPYSSVSAYFGIGQPEWLQQDKVIDLFESLPVYADFLDDSNDYEESLDDIKYELANNIL
jgi:PII-like signaling protein